MPPLVIMGGIMAAGAVTSAVVQSNAAKNAAKTQVAGTQAAQKQVDAAMSPYLESGKVANTTLMSMMGLGGPTPNAAPTSTMPVQPRLGAGQSGERGGRTRENTLAEMQPVESRAMPLQQAMAAQPGVSGSGYSARMQAPTGEVMDVPAAQIPHFQQRGARVIQ